MCGITGFYSKDRSVSIDADTILSNQISSIKQRGPDSYGKWKSTSENIFFGHTRLSILDLSEKASQPMISKNGRFIITFNGEIYNYKDLKKEICSKFDHQFSGSGDTEVLLESINYFGLSETLSKIYGMFAFALWDKKNQELTIARDRFGEKPIYYGLVNKSFVFGSDLSVFKSFPHFNNKINNDALDMFLRFNYVPSNLSIYQDIYKLDAGSFATINKKLLDNLSGNQAIEKIKKLTQRYWDPLTDHMLLSEKKYTEINNAILDTEKALHESVKRQMISDVPIGAFLSGGIDSSLITAIMQDQSSSKINTFTIGFSDHDYDESVYASKIAKYLNTNHTQMIVQSNDVINLVPELNDVYSEPFADSSQLPTLMLSKMTRDHVKVVLSGDGGDELFGGYNRYIWTKSLWNKFKFLPFHLRHILGKLLSTKNSRAIILNFLKNTDLRDTSLLENKISKVLNIFTNAADLASCYQLLLQNEHINLEPYFEGPPKDLSIVDSVENKMMLWDIYKYLPDDILTKVDRASMYYGLEARVPMLDPDVFSVSQRVPVDLKINQKTGKWVLQQVLDKYLPSKFFNRPKAGFAAPISEWLKGPLYEWANDLIDSSSFYEVSSMTQQHCKSILNDHYTNQRDQSSYLWSILLFQSWFQKNNISGHEIIRRG